MIEVVKMKEHHDAIYIGRGSPLGNPFIIGKDGNRTEVCRKYKEYFYEQVGIDDSPVRLELDRLIHLVKSGENIKLGCFCAPLECHGDTIKDYLMFYCLGNDLLGTQFKAGL